MGGVGEAGGVEPGRAAVPRAPSKFPFPDAMNSLIKNQLYTGQALTTRFPSGLPVFKNLETAEFRA